MRQLRLPSLKTEQFAVWANTGQRKPTRRFFVATSGYESRSSALIREVMRQSDRFKKDNFLVAGFADLEDKLSRPENDDFYHKAGLKITKCGSSREVSFIDAFANRLSETIEALTSDERLEIHIDYSCMPRHWYCRLPQILEEKLRTFDRAFFWYTPGLYTDPIYPTAGTSDFHVFSGRASLSAKFRTHLFGLGFDRVRSQAIWSVLDPRNLVCFYGDPAVFPSYVERVRSDNREVLDAASFVFTVPVSDFAKAFSGIRSAVFQFRQLGDIVIVPDGPKPLIFASSLVPLTLDEPSGVVCFHVSKRKMEGFTPVDVPAAGEAVGFSIGSRQSVASTERDNDQASI
ncbi:MAG TPA: hypothetical protein VJU77_09875 [Chthoniobacterales bacterium]|nr:hypothetical protein [Chthoniobacterales bacterium]